MATNDIRVLAARNNATFRDRVTGAMAQEAIGYLASPGTAPNARYLTFAHNVVRSLGNPAVITQWATHFVMLPQADAVTDAFTTVADFKGVTDAMVGAVVGNVFAQLADPPTSVS